MQTILVETVDVENMACHRLGQYGCVSVVKAQGPANFLCSVGLLASAVLVVSASISHACIIDL